MSLLDAVNETLDELDLKSVDAGLAELARNLASRIDDEKSGRTASELAAKLHAVIQTLTEDHKAQEVPSDSRLGKLRAVGSVREA
ncbi:hypothetical protein [Amycolatopsis sp. NPDC051903]|uniref:hypothetical protein n=1 Tax=Amycolatopsis sp. NPDC051903 TaxID=3363936 RepID=UPI00379B210D